MRRPNDAAYSSRSVRCGKLEPVPRRHGLLRRTSFRISTRTSVMFCNSAATIFAGSKTPPRALLNFALSTGIESESVSMTGPSGFIGKGESGGGEYHREIRAYGMVPAGPRIVRFGPGP